jgi:hypothetical protein
MTCIKTAAFAAFLATVYSLVDNGNAVSTGTTRYLRFPNSGASKQFIPTVLPVGAPNTSINNSNSKAAIRNNNRIISSSSKRIPSDRALKEIFTEGRDNTDVGDVTMTTTIERTSSRSIRLIKRCTKERTITLHGIDHYEPLTPAQAVFLEDALKNALNDDGNDNYPDGDRVNTRAALLIKEELDEEYYLQTAISKSAGISSSSSSSSTNMNGGRDDDRRFLRAGANTRRELDDIIPSSSLKDKSIFFDMHFILDVVCYAWDDDDDIVDRSQQDETTIHNIFPILDSSIISVSACQVCDPNDAITNIDDDNDDADVVVFLAVPVGEMGGEMDASPQRLRPVRSGEGSTETNFCAAIRTGPFSRFESISRCSIK